MIFDNLDTKGISMRTRTSPRNQETLWRALGGKSPSQVVPELTLEEEIARLETQLAAPFLNKRTRGQLQRELDHVRARLAVRGALATSP